MSGAMVLELPWASAPAPSSPSPLTARRLIACGMVTVTDLTALNTQDLGKVVAEIGEHLDMVCTRCSALLSRGRGTQCPCCMSNATLDLPRVEPDVHVDPRVQAALGRLWAALGLPRSAAVRP